MAINEGVGVEVVECQASGVVDGERHLPSVSPGSDVLAGKCIRLTDELGRDAPSSAGDLSSEAHQSCFAFL